jgi:hypothetical protein
MKRYREQRKHHRVICSTPACIIDEGSFLIECTVVDLSVSGARLKLPSAANVQNGVVLRIPSKGIEHRIDVVWRAGDQAGVVFWMNILDRDDAIVPQPKVSPKPIPVPHLRKMVLEKLQVAERIGPEAEMKGDQIEQIEYVRCVLTGILAGAGAAANILFGFGRF